MARDAAARLYDVDQSTFEFKKLDGKGRYDHGTIAFRAKQGRLIDLDQLHESIWATRLSGGTNSGLVRLDVTAVGEVIGGTQTTLRVAGSDEQFILAEDPEAAKELKGARSGFQKLQEALANGAKVVSVTGRVEGWHGRWPSVLRALPPKPRKILVSSFETAKD